MFAGHLGAALAIGRAARRVNVGLFVTAAPLLGFTVAGMTITPPPPSARAMAWSSLLTLSAVCALVLWLNRPPGKVRA